MKKLIKDLELHRFACKCALESFKAADECISGESEYFKKVDAAHTWLGEAGIRAMWLLIEAKPAHRDALINLLKARYLKAINQNQNRFGKWVSA